MQHIATPASNSYPTLPASWIHLAVPQPAPLTYDWHSVKGATSPQRYVSHAAAMLLGHLPQHQQQLPVQLLATKPVDNVPVHFETGGVEVDVAILGLACRVTPRA